MSKKDVIDADDVSVPVEDEEFVDYSEDAEDVSELESVEDIVTVEDVADVPIDAVLSEVKREHIWSS